MSIYGKKGIDTAYERAQIARNVKLFYPEKENGYNLIVSTYEEIQRAREFNISNVIIGYEDLLKRIQEMMDVIEKRKAKDPDFKTFMSLLTEEGYKNNAIKKEESKSGIRHDLDYEIYSLLFRLKSSISMQVKFQYDYYAPQFTEDRSLDSLIVEEHNSISDMVIKQNDFLHAVRESEHDEDSEDWDSMNKEIRKLSLLHETNGDIAFSHINRQSYLDVTVTRCEDLVYRHKEMVEGNMEHMIHAVNSMSNKEMLKTQLLIKFSDLKRQHAASKGQYSSYSEAIESYGSEVAYLQKNIKTAATEQTMSWLYEQEPTESRSLDELNELLVDGIEISEKMYESSNGSMTQFYKSEANFFVGQLNFIQEKQKIRLFFSIIEDLEDSREITTEWVENYLVSKGYGTSAEV